MKLFVFKVHEQTPYTDGMVLVVASTAEKARQYLLALDNCDAFGSHKIDGKFVGANDSVTLVRADHEKEIDHVEWYMADTFELRDEYTGTEGVQLVAYHDG